MLFGRYRIPLEVGVVASAGDLATTLAGLVDFTALLGLQAFRGSDLNLSVFYHKIHIVLLGQYRVLLEVGLVVASAGGLATTTTGLVYFTALLHLQSYRG